MTEEELKIKLEKFRRLPAETEVFEFKEARNSYDSNKLGKYFSALSNEANLKGKPYAWLIFGIKDKGRTIVGSRFRHNRRDLDNLKGELANKTINRISFIEIYELHLPEGRIVMFQIPAASKGILPDILTESQKKNKVTNLLSTLRIKGIIRNNGYSKWSPV
ncbi:MAG: ATP-binding protein [Patescibacteria group bacterium]|nr:ATP-binding protein [Patescibacteria group bacterium]